MTKQQRDRRRHPEGYCPACKCRLKTLGNGARLCINHLCPSFNRPVYPVTEKGGGGSERTEQ
jgi:hypothetical protein